MHRQREPSHDGERIPVSKMGWRSSTRACAVRSTIVVSSSDSHATLLSLPYPASSPSTNALGSAGSSDGPPGMAGSSSLSICDSVEVLAGDAVARLARRHSTVLICEVRNVVVILP